MLESVVRWGHVVLRFDDALQVATAVGALCGLLLTAWSLLRTARQRHQLVVAGIDGARRAVLCWHLEIQGLIVLCQALLFVTAILTWSLPPIPREMYEAIPHGPWIVVTLTLRKGIRLAITILLALLSYRHVQWVARRTA